MVEQIKGMFMHCRACISAKRPDRVAAICDGMRIQIWCEACNQNIGIFKLSKDNPKVSTECQGPDHGEDK